MFSVLVKLDWFFKGHWKRYKAAILLLDSRRNHGSGASEDQSVWRARFDYTVR